MSNRVVIGDKNGRAGVWVAPPGGDALSENQRFLLNSDYTHLKLHYAVRVDSAGNYNPDLVTYVHDGQTINFPALAFIPLAFVFVGRRVSDYRVNFPPYSLTGDQWRAEMVQVYNDRIVTGEFYYDYADAYVYLQVYMNPVEY